jgi:RpiR family transcriptional regulator, carbohydrate utilization regulator
MTTYGGGLIRLKESLTQLSSAEGKVADYILNNPESFINMTVQELSNETGASTASVVRLWKTLGFDGYHDFKMRILSDLHVNEGETYSELKFGKSLSEVFTTIEMNTMESVRDTLRLQSEKSFIGSAHAILNARKIVAFGIGASAVVALDAYQKFTSTGFDIAFADNFYSAASMLNHFTADDLVIVISYTGKTVEALKTLNFAKNHGVPTISISQIGGSQLAQHSNYSLYVSSKEPLVRVAATTSRITSLIIVDALFLYVLNLMSANATERLEKSRQLGELMRGMTD